MESRASAFGSALRLVFSESRRENRFHRMRSRFTTYAALQSADPQSVEAQVEDVKPLPSVTIADDGALESLCQPVDAWMSRTGLGGQK